MSLQHIPKCIWWPLGALISALTIFLIVFTWMLVKAKQVEIQLAQVSILVEYADNYATQLVQISNTLQATVSQLETQDKVSIPPLVNQHDSSKNSSEKQMQNYNAGTVSTVPVSTKLILQEKKQQLEIINHGLQLLKNQLPAGLTK